MTANSQAKLKLLRIMQMLQDETDATQGLSMSDIIQRLNEQGIQAERPRDYRDLALLRPLGLAERPFQRNPVQYANVQRSFSLPELKILVDTVQACPFVTQRQADALVRTIREMASPSQRSQLARPVHVSNRVRQKSESVLSNVDLAHRALAAKSQVTFDYAAPSPEGGAETAGESTSHTHTPVAIAYAEGTYHLACWNEADERFDTFRMDRMENLEISERPAVRNDAIRSFSFDS